MVRSALPDTTALMGRMARQVLKGRRAQSVPRGSLARLGRKALPALKARLVLTARPEVSGLPVQPALTATLSRLRPSSRSSTPRGS